MSSALYQAVEKKHRVLIAAGARALPNSAKTALIMGDGMLVQVILDAGADVNAKIPREYGFTVNGVVARQGNIGLAS